MSTIDLGDNPVGSTPTDTQKTQLRSSIGLGSSDTVEFGAIVPPAGTTAEIDAVVSATVGQTMLDTSRNRYVRFTGPSSYDIIGYTDENTYYVSPQNGSDTAGSAGGFPFSTINAALLEAVTDGASPIKIECMSGSYSEEDSLNGVSTNEEVFINFAIGSKYDNTGMSTALFSSAGTITNLKYIGGDLIWVNGDYGFFNGAVSDNTRLELESVTNSTSSAPLFTIVNGSADIKIKGVAVGISQPIIEVSGTGNVRCKDLVANYSIPSTFSPAQPATVSDGLSLNLINAKVKDAGLCDLTSTGSSSKLIIENCISKSSFPAGSTFSVRAVSGVTSNTVFSVGFNAFSVAPSNVTIDETFGQVIVNSSVTNLV